MGVVLTTNPVLRQGWFARIPGVAKRSPAPPSSASIWARRRKIRISARLWVNSRDARYGCKRALESSWCRRGKPNSPPTVAARRRTAAGTLDLQLERSRPTSSKCRVFVDYLVERWRVANPFDAGTHERSIGITEPIHHNNRIEIQSFK